MYYTLARRKYWIEEEENQSQTGTKAKRDLDSLYSGNKGATRCRRRSITGFCFVLFFFYLISYLCVIHDTIESRKRNLIICRSRTELKTDWQKKKRKEIRNRGLLQVCLRPSLLSVLFIWSPPHTDRIPSDPHRETKRRVLSLLVQCLYRIDVRDVRGLSVYPRIHIYTKSL